MRKVIDSYTVYARFLPCIISALPGFILWYFLADNVELQQLASYILSLKFVEGVSLSVVFLVFYGQVIRVTSKHFENKYFTSGAGFPTTYLMTYTDDKLSKAYKDKYREHVHSKFSFELLDDTEEKDNICEARKRLAEAAEMVKVKVGNGSLVLKHDCWYGFWRNLIGGTIYSIVISLTNILIGAVALRNAMLVILSAILLLMYGLVFVLRERILVQNAEAYAKRLIVEFLALE